MSDYLIRDFPEDLHKAAKHQAVDEKITLRDLILKAVEEYLKATKKKGGK
jgi:predicted HicB family RNase H-like nuclease